MSFLHTSALQEVETECAELAGYILSSPQFFADYGSTKKEALFMEEVLNGVIENSNRINSMLVA